MVCFLKKWLGKPMKNDRKAIQFSKVKAQIIKWEADFNY